MKNLSKIQIKKLQKAGLITSKGTLNSHVINALRCSKKDYEQNKFYPFHWTGIGKSATDYTFRVLEIITALGYKIVRGNDAPKGGQNGNFIEVSSTAFNLLNSL